MCHRGKVYNNAFVVIVIKDFLAINQVSLCVIIIFGMPNRLKISLMNSTAFVIVIVRIVGGKKEIQSLAWKKLPQYGGQKNHGKTDLLCGVLYRVQGVLFIYIGKGDRDMVIIFLSNKSPLDAKSIKMFPQTPLGC
jgi:hypothetical protein